MDRNLLLAFALSFLVLFLWSSWQSEQQGDGFPEGITSEPTLMEPESTPLAPSLPSSGEQRAVEPAPRQAAIESSETSLVQRQELARTVDLETELFRARLTTRGGALVGFQLSDYFDAPTNDASPIELTTLDRSEGTLATPLRGLGLGDLSQAPFELDQPSAYEVAFHFEAGGIHVRKLYTFDPESYAFRLRLSILNGSDHQIQPMFEVIWPAHGRDTPDFAELGLVALTQGSVEKALVGTVGQPGFFSRLSGTSNDGGPILYQNELEWAGAETRYFLAALIPEVPRDAFARFEPVEKENSARTVLGFRPVRLPPGQELEREYRVYIGPKDAEILEAVGAQLERSIDSGWSFVRPLTQLFSWMLRACYSVIPNYGISIILITLLVRLTTIPLMTKQMRSMKKMSQLQPKMKEIQALYADDKQRQSQETMKLYKESGVNPLGGCLPMILQLPVFIGLYWSLQSSIDLRHEPFLLWITDLSAPETLFTLPGVDLPVRVLPLLMGVSMVLQQKLTPTSVDPAQARMMMTIMPVMFTVLFYRFPSGLVLYWFVSNLLGIGHQLWVNRGGDPVPASKQVAAPERTKSKSNPTKSKRSGHKSND